MKFDFAIGNPPYQASNDTYNRQEPVYPHFYDAAENISKKAILISPARFLFNAGLTPQEWNRKMLSDKHLKVEYYNENAGVLFPNTDIKGGIAIIYRDNNRDFGAIEEFIPNDSIRSIASHFYKDAEKNLPSIMHGGRSALKFNDKFLEDYPESVNDRLEAIRKKHPKVKKLGPNEEYEIKSSTLTVLSYAFQNSKPENNSEYYRILGLMNGRREYRYIKKKYLTPRYPLRNNIDKYKVFIPKASGTGLFGEAISAPGILCPDESSTPSFITIGAFDTIIEAQNACKYIKTKFARALLSIIKITQDIVPSKWAYVPLQNFMTESDIDWNQSISEIDQQLYKKYSLTQEEIDFIESNVKEME